MAAKTKIKNSISKSQNNIEYITDGKGRKTKVVIPLPDYENLLEDLHDLAIVAERKNEKYISFEKVVQGLKKDALLL